MDATRRRDGKQVMLKKVLPDEGPHELTITQSFSSRQIARDPCNHCVPLLDILEMPQNGQKLLVMPFLRPFNNPSFQTFGEFVAFFTQICEVGFFQHPSLRINSDGALDQGLQFMHQRNIAHRFAWTLPDGMHHDVFDARSIQGLHSKQHYVRPI
jgi:serine/threonine protein kinase